MEILAGLVGLFITFWAVVIFGGFFLLYKLWKPLLATTVIGVLLAVLLPVLVRWLNRKTGTNVPTTGLKEITDGRAR